MPLAAWEEKLRRALPDYGVEELGEDAVGRLAVFLEMLSVANRKMRLVGSSAVEVLVRRHVGESLFAGPYLPPVARLLDVGSGAGFPGLALGLAYPGMKTTLVECTQKKARFLRSVVDATGTSAQIEVRGERLDGHSAGSGAELVTCRALEQMVGVPGWVGRQVKAGGRGVFWVTREMAAAWVGAYPQWRWEEPRLLPGSERRVVVSGVLI